MSEALWAAAIGGVLAPAMSTPFAPFLVAGMTGWGLYNAAVELKAGQYGLTIFDLATIILLPKLLERIPQLGAGGAAADEGVEAVELIAAEEAAGGAIKGSPEIEALGTAGDEPARVSRCEGMECFTAGYRVVVSLNPDGTYQTVRVR